MASPEAASTFKLLGIERAFDNVVKETCHDRYNCDICSCVMQDPATINPCGHMCDKSCINNWVKKGEPGAAVCPKGCGAVITSVIKSPDIRQLIRETVKVRCINQCCETLSTIDLLIFHVKDECEQTRFKCMLVGPDGDICGDIVSRVGMAAHKDVSCPYVAVPCGHSSCKEQVLRCNLKEHMSNCEMKPVDCVCGKLTALKLENSQLKTEVLALKGRVNDAEAVLVEHSGRIRPDVEAIANVALLNGATAMIEITDSVEMRWTADLTTAEEKGSRVYSPTFICGGWLFHILLELQEPAETQNKWGIYCACPGPAAPLANYVEAVRVQAEYTLGVSATGYTHKGRLVEGMRLDGGGWGHASAMTLPKGQTSLTALVRMGKVVIHYKVLPSTSQ